MDPESDERYVGGGGGGGGGDGVSHACLALFPSCGQCVFGHAGMAGMSSVALLHASSRSGYLPLTGSRDNVHPSLLFPLGRFMRAEPIFAFESTGSASRSLRFVQFPAYFLMSSTQK